MYLARLQRRAILAADAAAPRPADSEDTPVRQRRAGLHTQNATRGMRIADARL